MDHTYIEEHHLVDRYVMGRLPAPEAERFEEHFLACATCLDQLERSERMVRGLKRAAAEDVGRSQLALVTWLVRLGRNRQLGVLALALLVAVAVPSLLSQRAGRVPASFATPQGNVALLPLGTERGSAGEPSRKIYLAEEPRWIVLTLVLDQPELGPFRAVLRRSADNAEIWTGTGLEPDGDSLTFTLPPGFLTPGDYQLEVTATAAGAGPATRFPFRVLPPS